MKIEFGDRTVDLEKAFPMTLGDLRVLGKSGLLTDQGDLNLSGAEGIIGLLLHIANKAREEGEEKFTEEQIETLDLKKIPEITQFFTKMLGGEEVDRPTSPQSTSSP